LFLLSQQLPNSHILDSRPRMLLPPTIGFSPRGREEMFIPGAAKSPASAALVFGAET
jgi:hypothetical protein